MCLEGLNKDLDRILELIGNEFFVPVFTLEAILKFLAFRHYFFTQGWNIFDLCIVALSILGSPNIVTCVFHWVLLDIILTR